MSVNKTPKKILVGRRIASFLVDQRGGPLVNTHDCMVFIDKLYTIKVIVVYNGLGSLPVERWRRAASGGWIPIGCALQRLPGQVELVAWCWSVQRE